MKDLIEKDIKIQLENLKIISNHHKIHKNKEEILLKQNQVKEIVMIMSKVMTIKMKKVQMKMIHHLLESLQKTKVHKKYQMI